MDETLENTESQETPRIKTDEKGRFVKGTAPGPGRPQGSVSIKDLVRKHLQNNPEDLQEFVKHFIKDNRELAWQMLEGRPQQDIVSDGKPLPSPIYGGQSISIPGHSSNEEDIPAEEED